MPTKLCQLDVIPKDKLKRILGGCLPALTHIINKSLETNQFCSEWKETLVKPPIKKKTHSRTRKIKLQTGKFYMKGSRKGHAHTIYQTLS